MLSIPKVSVILPSLNVAEYISECIESVMHQTLKEIEIICVDAASTDGTTAILEEYAKNDTRIQIINSEKKSYGYQMNLGIKAAKGEYIGIVETDDWIESNTLESLWSAAKRYHADMVKSNYFWYTTKNGINNVPFENLRHCEYNKVFRPLKEKNIFKTTPAIWSGIYSRKMLLENNIRFNETKGASFQDTSFHFMVCTVAQRCVLIPDHLLHYRRDNDGSSVHAKGKVFCVADEIHYYEAFLDRNPEYKEQMELFFQALKYEKYRWNYNRLAIPDQIEFLKLMHKEYVSANKEKKLIREFFSENEWNAIQTLMQSPQRYFEDHCTPYALRTNSNEHFPYTVLKNSNCTEPEVSIILPVHNYEKYVATTMQSLQNQTLKNIEIICIDDGSTDRSLEILLEISDRDSRITVCTQVNKGQGAARNVGLSLAKGKYIAFIDADDALIDNALKNLTVIANEKDLDILLFDGTSVYESETLAELHPVYKRSYEYSHSFPNVISGTELFTKMKQDDKYRVTVCMALYRKEFLDRIGAIFTEGIFHEDQLFSYTVTLSADRVWHISDKYYLRRVHTNSVMTGTKTFKHFYGYLSTLIDFLTLAKSHNENMELSHQICREVDHLIQCTKNTYLNIPNDKKKNCLAKLTPIEMWYFERLIHPLTEPQKHEHIVERIVVDNSTAIAIMQSPSYKIGRIITFIPRKLRTAIRVCREHGPVYTIKLTFNKLFSRK